MTHTNLAAVAALDALASAMGLPAYSALALHSSAPLRSTLAGISTNSDAPTTPAPRSGLSLPPAQAQAIHASLCALNTVAKGAGRVLRFDENQPSAHTRRVSVVVDTCGEVVITAGSLRWPDFVEVHVNQNAFASAYGFAQ